MTDNTDLIREAREWDANAVSRHAVSALDTIRRLADALEAATAPEPAALTPTDRLAALIGSCVSDRETWHRAVDAVFGEAPEPAGCEGHACCPAKVHVHGCFNDHGSCDQPAHHEVAERLLRSDWLAGRRAAPATVTPSRDES